MLFAANILSLHIEVRLFSLEREYCIESEKITSNQITTQYSLALSISRLFSAALKCQVPHSGVPVDIKLKGELKLKFGLHHK